MNTEQIASIVRTGLKLVAGILAAHGLADTASIVNTPDAVSLVLLIISASWSHFSHASPPAPPSKPTVTLMIALASASLLFTGSGCSTTPERVTYQSAASVTVTAAEAVRAYNVFAAAGKTTVAQNLQVKAAFENYQASMAVACDLGAAYAAASGSTNNAAGARLALATATANVSQELSDLLALIRSFGVNI